MIALIKATAMFLFFVAFFAVVSAISKEPLDMQNVFNATAFYALITAFEKPRKSREASRAFDEAGL